MKTWTTQPRRRPDPPRQSLPDARRDCPCGQQHIISGALDRQIRDGGPTRPVLTRFGAWRVPLVFAAVHGAGSDVIRDAATRYGFPQVTL